MTIPETFKQWSTGRESRNSPPVRAARDVLVGYDLMHHLMTSFKTVDFDFAWRALNCTPMAVNDMIFLTQWSTKEIFSVKAPAERIFASDEFFRSRDS